VKYRSRTDITVEILQSAKEGNRKSKIMNEAFLSFIQIEEYLEMLKVNKLLEYEEKSKMFKTTVKGLVLLEVYMKMGSMVDSTIKKR
jgi:predicted transcriptional regulator